MKWLSLLILSLFLCSKITAKHKAHQKFTVKLQSGWDRLSQLAKKPQRKLLPKLGVMDKLGKLTGGLLGTSTEELAKMTQKSKLQARHRVLSSSLSTQQSDSRLLMKSLLSKIEGLNSKYDTFESDAVSQMIMMGQRALMCISQIKGQPIVLPEDKK